MTSGCLLALGGSSRIKAVLSNPKKCLWTSEESFSHEPRKMEGHRRLAHTDRLFISLELLPPKVETSPFKYLTEIQKNHNVKITYTTSLVSTLQGYNWYTKELLHKCQWTSEKMTKSPVKHAASEIPSCYKGCFEKEFFKIYFYIICQFQSCKLVWEAAPLDLCNVGLFFRRTLLH